MRSRKSFLVIGALIVFAGQASAAMVTSERGQVLLNRGDGYRLVTTAADAAPGHLVVANPGGVGRVLYPDGCSVEVQPGSVLAITAKSPCETAGTHVETGGSLKDQPTLAPAQERSWLGPAAIAAGVAVGVGVILLNDKDKPASP